jgi:DNA-binding PadR family transcriptional regulator
MDTTSAKELFVLGRISLRPTHGHEIMRTLRGSHADLWVELSEKHVYYVLRKLDREGLIAASHARSGNLPARNVYTITAAGRTALARMMSAERHVTAMPSSEFDVVLGMLCYTDELDDDAKSDVLARRRAALEERLAEVAGAANDTGAADGAGGFPALMLAKIARDAASELELLRAVAAEVARSGWASMKPVIPGA